MTEKNRHVLETHISEIKLYRRMLMMMPMTIIITMMITYTLTSIKSGSIAFIDD